jgi:hypothetical protein
MGALAAGISAGGSLLSGVISGKGAKKAAKAQAAAIQQAIQEQHNEFAQTQANEAPFLQAGTSALNDPNGLMALLGMSGNDAQGSAISHLKDSPLFTSQYGTGLDAILQSASATGGLRGGNTQNSLAQFGSGLLSNVLQNQIGNLGGLVGTGANAAAGLASAGQNNANAVSNLFTQQGNAQASGILGQATATTSTINDLSKILQKITGGASLQGGGF